MYYRNPDYFQVDRLSKTRSANLDPQPLARRDHILLSIGVIVTPILVFFLALAIGHLVSAF